MRFQMLNKSAKVKVAADGRLRWKRQRGSHRIARHGPRTGRSDQSSASRRQWASSSSTI